MDDLEAERQQAIRMLSSALTANRLPIEQFESRLALVRQAPNRATLDAIVADLTPTGEYPPPLDDLPPTAADHTAVAPIAPADVLRIRTVLSSSRRAGSWSVPHRLELKVVLGDLTIDLRNAEFFSDLLEVDLDVLLGSLTLIVPAGVQVENECEERWSSTTHSTRSSRGASPIGLLIRLTGRVRWSSVEIKEKRPTGGEPPSRWKRFLGIGR